MTLSVYCVIELHDALVASTFAHGGQERNFAHDRLFDLAHLRQFVLVVDLDRDCEATCKVDCFPDDRVGALAQHPSHAVLTDRRVV